MPIPVTEQPDAAETPLSWREHCAFCWKRTTYWFNPKDVAVCPTCATLVKPSDVPSKKVWWDQKTGIHVQAWAETVVDAVAEALGVDTGTAHENRVAAAVEAVLKVKAR